MFVVFEICAGVTCTATEEFRDGYLRECHEAQVEAELRAWLLDPANEGDINYSDIFKEVYGVRPR